MKSYVSKSKLTFFDFIGHKKIALIITKSYDWLQRSDPFQKSRTENLLMSLSTGLYYEDDSVNAEQEEDVG